MDLKSAIKQLRLLSVHRLEFSKRLHGKSSIFTAELEEIVSALSYIKSTAKNNKFVVLVTLNLHCMPCCLSGIITQFNLL